MKHEKHTRLTLETRRVCRLAPATAGEHLHIFAINFLRYSKHFLHGTGTYYEVSTVTHHTLN